MSDVATTVDTRHNHLKKLWGLVMKDELPEHEGLLVVNAYHAEKCAIWSGDFCNCDPRIELLLPPDGASVEDLVPPPDEVVEFWY